MGLRNPSRLFIDPETDIPYSAWVGPDAGSPSATQGPSTYENATQLAQAGNYGWPYCMGNQQAYRDRVADGSLRTTNAAGFVTGGPAGSPTQGWYDCNNIVNDSTNNTGLTVLPHTTGTGMDAGRARPLNLWYSRGNPGGANGCPNFPRENGANGAPNYGAKPDPALPVPDRLRRDRLQRPRLPLSGGRGQLGPLARVLGRPLVPPGLRQQQRQARPAARPRHRPGRRQAGLRGQPAELHQLEQQLHGLEVRARRRALRPGLRRVLHHRAGRRHVPVRLHRRAGHAEPRPAVDDDRHAAPDPVLARQLGRRLRTSGTSATAPRSRPSRTRRTPTRRPARTTSR